MEHSRHPVRAVSRRASSRGQRISSSWMTRWTKYPVPGVAMVGAGAILVSGVLNRPFNPLSLLFASALIVLAVVIRRALVRDLADEVRDGGDYLLVRNGAIQEKLMVRDLATVSRGFGHNPERLILRLRRPGRLGDTIAFIPRGQRWFPFVEHPLVLELRTRAELLRSYT